MKVEKTSVISFVILPVFLSVFLAGCGMQGDLYLPGSEDPNTGVTLEKLK